MNADDVKILDSPTRVTPFGARFWDAATRRFIADGLRLKAYRAGETRTRAVEGFVNPSGVHLLAGLPGLRNLENGRGDAAYWAQVSHPTSPSRPPYRIEMTDTSGRFLPYWFNADLPKRGLYRSPALPTTSPTTSPPGAGAEYLPLFSAPARKVPAALAVVRAQLRVAGTTQPAAWALVHAYWRGERICTGLADREGRVALLFAYPEPVPKHLQRASPPQEFSEGTWDIDLQAHYTPRAGPAPEIENLETILAQEPRPLLEADGLIAMLPQQRLTLGAELVAHSYQSSYLFVQTT